MNPTILASLIEEVRKADSLEGIHALSVDFCCLSGFDNFFYGANLSTSSPEPCLLVVNEYPQEWSDRYFACGYQSIDPVVAHCETRVLPILWADIEHGERKSRVVNQFMAEARDFGLCSGCSFPVHGTAGEFGLLSLSSRKEPPDMQRCIFETLPFAQLFTSELYEATNRVVQGRKMRPDNDGPEKSGQKYLIPLKVLEESRVSATE